MNVKNKELLYLNRDSFYENFEKIQKNPKKYIILISIKDESFKDDVALITFLKKHFKTNILDNVIAISDTVLLANDLDIFATLYLKDYNSFEFSKFQHAFSAYKSKFKDLKDFLEAVSSAYFFTLDTYIYENPWFFSINDLGILSITDNTIKDIENNYPKIRWKTSDIILIHLNNSENDEIKKKLLKMLGFDSLLTFAVTNKKSTKFIKYIDLILYNKSKNVFENSLNFVKSFMLNNKFDYVIKYLEIEERDFETDMFFEKEPKREPKKYEMVLSNKKSFSKAKLSQLNKFYEKEVDKYFILTRVY